MENTFTTTESESALKAVRHIIPTTKNSMKIITSQAHFANFLPTMACQLLRNASPCFKKLLTSSTRVKLTHRLCPSRKPSRCEKRASSTRAPGTRLFVTALSARNPSSAFPACANTKSLMSCTNLSLLRHPSILLSTINNL